MSSTATDLNVERAIRDIQGRLDRRIREATLNHGQVIAIVDREDRVAALTELKDLGFTLYVFCGGVDWPDDSELEVLDHVYSIQRRVHVTLRCRVPYDDPSCPSAADVFAGADWHERETWELYGIVFQGHPRLARLLLPEWFEGFPMRKEFILPPRVEKPWPGESFTPDD